MGLLITRQNGAIYFDFGDGKPLSLSINDPKSFTIGSSDLYIKLQSNKFSREVLKTDIVSVDNISVTSFTVYETIALIDGLFGNPTFLTSSYSLSLESLETGSSTISANSVKRVSVNPNGGTYTLQLGSGTPTDATSDFYDTGLLEGGINTDIIITRVTGKIYIEKTV